LFKEKYQSEKFSKELARGVDMDKKFENISIKVMKQHSKPQPLKAKHQSQLMIRKEEEKRVEESMSRNKIIEQDQLPGESSYNSDIQQPKQVYVEKEKHPFTPIHIEELQIQTGSAQTTRRSEKQEALV